MTDEVRKEVAELLDEFVELAENKNRADLESRIKRHREIAERLRVLLDLPAR
jgi:hypothetical protein